MKPLNIGVKTGFVVKDRYKPIIIRDFRGILFYETESMIPKVEYFNLPAGQYFVERGHFSETLLPRTYPLAVLPQPERMYPDPTFFDIQFGDNPNKCSILWDEKVIVFDGSFKEKPQAQIYFVLFHEYGHKLYNTEHYADLYAANRMKMLGFNPYQIQRAHSETLSHAAQDRKEFLTNHLTKDLN